jgi:transposase
MILAEGHYCRIARLQRCRLGSPHPGIKIISRDRGGGYGEAVAKALPDAIQIADRWHLMENRARPSSKPYAAQCA